jgi:hypothetical protein
VDEAMITNYKHRKLIQYLQPGQKVLIRFGHGLGDAIMFMPVLEELRRRRPDTQIDLYVECGQEKIWNSVPNKEAEGYDWIFSLDFPMSEGSGLTKREKCARDELGLHTGVRTVAGVPVAYRVRPFPGHGAPGAGELPGRHGGADMARDS